MNLLQEKKVYSSEMLYDIVYSLFSNFKEKKVLRPKNSSLKVINRDGDDLYIFDPKNEVKLTIVEYAYEILRNKNKFIFGYKLYKDVCRIINETEHLSKPTYKSFLSNIFSKQFRNENNFSSRQIKGLQFLGLSYFIDEEHDDKEQISLNHSMNHISRDVRKRLNNEDKSDIFNSYIANGFYVEAIELIFYLIENSTSEEIDFDMDERLDNDTISNLPSEINQQILQRNPSVVSVIRARALEICERKCVLTNENNLELIDACHIRPWSEFEHYRVKLSNIIIMHKSLHVLFDKGIFTIDNENGIQISKFASAFSISLLNTTTKLTVLNNLHSIINKFPDILDNLEWHKNNIFEKKTAHNALTSPSSSTSLSR